MANQHGAVVTLTQTLEAPHARAPHGAAGDRALLSAARNGSTAAWAELWSRHYPAAIRTARQYVLHHEAEDLVSHAFLRIHSVLVSGGGPQESLRPYLLTTVRNTAHDLFRRRREYPCESVEETAESVTLPVPPADRETCDDVARAFSGLPSRWQDALWLREVQQRKLSEVARELGLNANSAAALCFRAREGLRRAWHELQSGDELSDPGRGDAAGERPPATHSAPLR